MLSGYIICRMLGQAGINVSQIVVMSKSMYQVYTTYYTEYLKHLDSYEKHTLFLYACGAGKIEYGKILFPYIDPNICNGKSLGLACQSGCIELIKLILTNENINFLTNVNLWTIKDIEIIKILLDDKRLTKSMIKSDCKFKCMYGYDSFDEDDNLREYEIIKLLFDKLMDRLEHIKCLNSAIKSGRKKLVEYILKNSDIREVIDHETLLLSCEKGFYGIVKQIFHHLYDKSGKLYQKCIILAAQIEEKSGVKIVKYILKHLDIKDSRIAVNYFLNKCLHDICKFNSIDTGKLILDDTKFKYIQIRTLRVVSKCDIEFINLIFNHKKLNYSSIDDKIIEDLILYDHQKLVNKLLEDPRVKIQDSNRFKRKYVEDILDPNFNLEKSIENRLKKKFKCI